MSLERLLDRADAIAASIRNSDVAAEYWQAKRKMADNARAQALYEELKLKTNARIILEERLEPDHPKLLLAQMEVHDVERQLQEIPVAIQYKTAQAELNDLVQSVVQVILQRLSEALPVELGPRQGCGQGHGGNGCDCDH